MSYPRNAASPPPLFATVVKAADGTAITSAVAAKYSTGAGSQAAGGGTCQHEGNGQWSYTPTQAETNVIGFGVQFYHADAVGLGPTISVVTSADVAQTGDAYARLGAPAGASVSADIAAVKSETATILDDTDDIGVAGAGLTAVPWNAAWDAEVQSEAVDALNAYDPPTKAELDAGLAALNDLDATEIRAAVGLAAANLDTQLDALPTNAELAAALAAADDATLAAIADVPTVAEFEARTLAAANYATAAALDAVDNYVDTEVSAIKGVTDKLDTALELDGAVYRLTENALELAPSGGAGLTMQQVRDAAKLAPSAGAAAAGSIDDLLADMPATILATAIAAYAGTPGTFGYLLSLLAGLDFTQVNLVAASNAGEITIKRTLTLAAVVSGLTIPADWTACYWTIKRSLDDADADARVQILVSNPPDADDGLLVLAGVAVEDQTAGSLTVNQALGTVAIVLGDASTALLEDAVELVWDVKVHAPAGKTQPGAGTATITTAVTRA